MTTVMRLAALCSAVLILVFSSGTLRLAQAQDAPLLTIKVTDPSGAIIPNAAVTLTRGTEERTVQADSNGVVEVPGLPTGEWSLAVRRDGFAVKQRPVIMQGVSQNITVILELAPLRQNVLVETVDAPPSSVQLNATASGGSYLDVSIKDLPFNLTVINQEYMRERGVTNLLDALELVGGVTTWADTGYIPAVDIRGLSTTDAGIYMAEDGIVPGTVPQTARNQDTFFLESVEVLKGPSSFSYGAGVAGASINSRAKMPRNELGFDTLVTYESFGRSRVGFLVTGPIRKNLAGLLAVVQNEGGTNVQRTQSSGRAWDTALTWTPLERVRFEAQGVYRTDHLSTYFSTPILNRRIDPNVDYIQVAANTFLDPRARTMNYNMQNPDNDVKTRRATFKTEVDLSHGWLLTHRLYLTGLQQDTLNNEGISFNQTTLRVTPGGYFFNFKRNWMHGNEVNARNTYRFWGRSVQFTVGGKTERSNAVGHAVNNSAGANPAIPSMDYLNPIAFEPTNRRAMKSATGRTGYNTGYFEAAFRILPKLTLSGGVRWDHIYNIRTTFSTGVRNRINFHPVTGRYALTYQLFPTITLYVGNTKAVQPSGTGVGSTGSVALINLNQTQAQFSEQTSRGWEGGVKASAWREKIQATASYFQMRKYNIQNQELIDGVTFVERVGKTKSEGIDTSFMVTPIRMFTLQGDFVWNNARYLVFNTVAGGVEVDRAGNWLARVPKTQWSATPIVRLGPVTASITIRYRDASWNNANNTQRLQTQTLMNANVNITMAKGFKVTLTGRNLTDELVMNRGGIVEGVTNARFGLPRNYSMQIARSW